MNLQKLKLVISVLSYLFISAKAATLDRNGGYTFTLALENGPEPGNSKEYIDQIKTAIQELSDLMRETTVTANGFYIEAVEIVIPNNWKESEGKADTTTSYDSADVRVSRNLHRPRVENKNQCGRPGEFIELPLSFFDKVEDGAPYGDHSKSLLHLWARYRWGVWEEHGHPGDHRFPYFYKASPDDEEWETTGCSNEKLTGELVNLDNSDDNCTSHEEYPLYPPPSTCRFQPDDDNRAKSSLMHFPWIKSVDKFCDHHDDPTFPHNILAPNRHNIFCWYRSVLEVIRECEDSRYINSDPGTTGTPEPPTTEGPPGVKITESRSSSRPLLYFLLDSGYHLIPAQQFVRVKSGLRDMFNGNVPGSTLVKIQKFPELPPARPPIPNWSSMEWASIDARGSDFDRYINNHEPDPDLGLKPRDFSKAIQNAVEEMYTLNPVSGGVLILLKTGGKANFDTMVPLEQELVSIVKGRPVKIFAIEFEESTLTPRVNLENIAKESAGRHLRLTRNSDIGSEVKLFIDAAAGVFLKSAVEVTNKDYVLLKKVVQSNEEINLPVLHDTLLPIRIVLTTKARLSPEDVRVNDGGPDLLFEASKEWQEPGSKTRNVLTAIIESVDKVESLKWLKYTCEPSSNDDCSGLLVIFGEETEFDDINIRLTTSAQDNAVYVPGATDIPEPLDIILHFPLSIFAEIKQKDQPLRGIRTSIATIKNQDTTDDPINLQLRDNGLAPDLFPNDGIYSGVFVPEKDGAYKISVQLAYHMESLFQMPENDSPSVRLLPVNQTDATCGGGGACDADLPTGTLARTWDLLGTINVVNSDGASFTPVPAPILDLTFHLNDGHQVILNWTAPYVIGHNLTNQKVQSYEICWAKTQKEVVEGNAACDAIDDFDPAEPGEPEFFDKGRVEGVTYYSVKSFYAGKESLLSNIVGVSPEEVVRPTTTTTTERSTTTVAPPIATHAYDIVVGIDEESASSDNKEEYVDNLIEKFGEFSSQMFDATFNSFYIRKIDIILPHSWDMTGTKYEDWAATADSMRTADIRISSKVLTPRVENPIPCGLPGNFMEFPYDFFSGSNDYGEALWKPLLHQWARYRWGVWEEHGYPGSVKFPYFYKPPKSDWETTGCSYRRMVGQILDRENQTCTLNDEDIRPAIDCRFRPNDSAVSESSLMYLHWVPGVEKFCDENTHNKDAPNKQNLFCRHRSTFEIIRRSLDLLNEDDELAETVPKTEWAIRKTSPSPLLYLLLDDAQNLVPEQGIVPIFGQFRTLLINLLGKTELAGTVSAIGKFPSNEPEGAYVKEEVHWSSFASNSTEFLKAIEKYPARLHTFRDFGLALHETINKIKKLKLDTGAVILMLKTGAAPNTLDKISFEEEILTSVRESNIKIYVIELRDSALKPQIHLKDLAAISGGIHLTVERMEAIPTLNSPIMKSLVAELVKPAIELPKAFRVMYKGTVSSQSELFMTVAPQEFSNVHVSLTSLAGLIPLENVNMTLERRHIKLKSKIEWAMDNEGAMRETLFGIEDAWNLGPSAQFNLSFTCSTIEPCLGFLVVEGELSKPTQKDNFNVIVSTSASGLGDLVDLSQDRQSTTPFGVFVKVEENNRPLRSVEKVQATFYLPDKSASWTFELKDDGYGTPDTFKNDGVYSGNFIPPSDGTYNMYVSVSHTLFKDDAIGIGHKKARHHVDHDDVEIDVENAESRLLPEDQMDTGCPISQCNTRSPSKNFVRVVEYAEPIVFQNSRLWNGKIVPAQILDLKAWPLDDNEILLSWTSPFSIGFSENEIRTKADLFEIGIANRLDRLTEFRFGNVMDRRTISTSIEDPGNVQRYTFTDRTQPGVVDYFAVRSRYQGQWSRPSNIVVAVTRLKEGTTEAPPETTEEPPEPTSKSTTPTTTRSTTRTTTTTTKRTTTTTTPIPATTEERVVQWYEKPEGYITLSVFGGVILLLGVSAIAYVFLRSYRSKKASDMNRSLIE